MQPNLTFSFDALTSFRVIHTPEDLHRLIVDFPDALDSHAHRLWSGNGVPGFGVTERHTHRVTLREWLETTGGIVSPVIPTTKELK